MIWTLSTVLAANKTLADSNLELKPMLDEKIAELATNYSNLETAEREFNQKNATVKSLRGQF